MWLVLSQTVLSLKSVAVAFNLLSSTQMHRHSDTESDIMAERDMHIIQRINATKLPTRRSCHSCYVALFELCKF